MTFWLCARWQVTGFSRRLSHKQSLPRRRRPCIGPNEPKMAKFIGIDIGTTSCKAVAMDEVGRVLGEFSVQYSLYTPHPGWTEQDPEDWWSAAKQCLHHLGEHDAIGFTGQMHGSVFLDEHDRVIRRALLWNDQRTAKEVGQMASKIGLDTIYRATCNPPLSGFQAPKILWLRNHEHDHFRHLRSVLLPKDYVRFRLTGDKLTEASDASGTGIFDVPNRRWATNLMEALDLNPSLFPRTVESCEFPGAGDQAAGAVGVGSIAPDVASISLGTSGVIFASQSDSTYDPKGRVHTFCHANGEWHSMGVMLSCGGALKWAKDAFGYRDHDEMAQLAKTAGVSQAQFYPYLAGERTPHNDPSLRGKLTGLALSDGKPEIAGAIFEGITFGLLDGLNALNNVRVTRIRSLRATGGGAKSDYWLQLIADVFGIPVTRMETDEGPAFGAALLAGVNAGAWRDLNAACKAAVRSGTTFSPNRSRHEDLLARYRTWSESSRDME